MLTSLYVNMAGINRNKHHYLLSWYCQDRLCAEIWLFVSQSHARLTTSCSLGVTLALHVAFLHLLCCFHDWQELGKCWLGRGFLAPPIDWKSCVFAGNVDNQEEDDVIRVLNEGKHNVPSLAKALGLRTLFFVNFCYLFIFIVCLIHI